MIVSFQNAILQAKNNLNEYAFLDEQGIANVSPKMQQIIGDIHKNIIRIIELSDAQHQERIMVLRTMVRELENESLLGDKNVQ